ncbi:hypothetical protein KLP28_14550 [Nocardioidaceae bacterium]|nr:hypothetical protein KLP28_14550 [Nocardioidaceae bacterium]
MSGSYAASRPPAPLSVAASLAAVQGMVLLALGIAEAVSVNADRLVMGATTTVFFLGLGLLLCVSAFGLTRRWTLARGPVLVVQLVQLGLAWNFRSVPVAAIGLAVYALVALAGLLNPASSEYLDSE